MSLFYSVRKFKEINDADIPTLNSRLSTMFFGNTTFDDDPTIPLPYLGDVTPLTRMTKIGFDTLADNYFEALTNIPLGGKIFVANKNLYRGQLILRYYGPIFDQIDLYSRGIQALILSAGVAAAQRIATHGALVQPVINNVVAHVGGQFMLSVNEVPFANAYVAFYSLTEGGPLMICGYSTLFNQILVSGLTPGQRYYLYVRAYGSGQNNHSPDSSPHPCFAI